LAHHQVEASGLVPQVLGEPLERVLPHKAKDTREPQAVAVLQLSSPVKLPERLEQVRQDSRWVLEKEQQDSN